jgi:excisionase family DNA binding protein|tara:strand:- start:1663 stop:1896 length:234 start_codon:yes stop_codon:yes gene_type:complete
MDAGEGSADGPDWAWMSTDAVAHRLGVATKTVYRLIDGGKLRAFRIGRVIRLKSVDVEAYEASCEISPGTLGHLHRP